MDGPGSLLGDFASGDTAPILDGEVPIQAAIKREQDSTDDFEHLDQEPKRESPLLQHGAARTVTESFLDMERDRFSGSPRPPSAADKSVDHLADKFTDSESEAGDSPLHRPQPVVPPGGAPLADLTPVLAPAPAVSSLGPKLVRELTPEPLAPEPKHEAPKPKPETSQLKPAAPEPTVEAPRPEPPRAPTAHVIEAEVIFCQMGLDAWFDPKRLHPKVESLIYWRDPARSGVALGAGLALLVSLACCSVVSVLAYGSLLALSAAVAFRLYRNVLQAVQKTNDGHPFKSLLERDIAVPAERAQSLAAGATAHLNAALAELRRLFLVEDLVDSLKFGVLLWCLTYVGACFNGITLIILGWVALFTLPKAYEMNKAQVDANLQLARDKINEITAKVRAAVPLGRKSDVDKDK